MHIINKSNDSVQAFDVTLPIWSGPLDLLLNLIRASKLKIQDISIKKITHDYLLALKKMKSLNMNLTADFLSMASTLIYIKSQVLLPKEFNDEQNEIEDPQQELIEKLLNYEKYKLVAEKLSNLSNKNEHYLEISKSKKIKKKVLDNEAQWEEISIVTLINAYRKIMESAKNSTIILSDKEFKIEDKINMLKKKISKLKKIKFENLFNKNNFKIIFKQEIVLTLWAILEMYKSNIIEVKQNKIFGDIYIFSNSYKFNS